MRVDFGTAPGAPDGFDFYVDICAAPDVPADKMVVANLNRRWPFDDDTIDYARAHDIIEHLHNKIHTMNELHRVLKPGGIADIAVPTTDGLGAWKDPTHCCYSEDTEIMTPRGFVPITSIKTGSEVMTANPGTMIAESIKCDHVIDEFFSGDLLHFITKRLDLLVTGEHNLWAAWPARREDLQFKWIKAKELYGLTGHHPVAMRATMGWKGESRETFDFKAPPREIYKNGGTPASATSIPAMLFMEFMGWFISEGWIHRERGERVYNGKKHHASTVGIAQSEIVHKDNCNRIEALIREMGFTPNRTGTSIVFQSRTLCDYLEPFGHSHEKYIPEEIKRLDTPLLRRFLDAYVAGDGTAPANGRGYYAGTTSKRLAADIQEIALKCGYRSTVFVEKREGKEFKMPRGKTSSNCRDIYMISMLPPANIWAPVPVLVPYTGRVICPVLPRHHLVLVRRNGRAVWSGNSFWNRLSFNYYEKGHPDRERFANNYDITAAFQILSEKTVRTPEGPRLEIVLKKV